MSENISRESVTDEFVISTSCSNTPELTITENNNPIISLTTSDYANNLHPLAIEGEENLGFAEIDPLYNARINGLENMQRRASILPSVENLNVIDEITTKSMESGTNYESSKDRSSLKRVPSEGVSSPESSRVGILKHVGTRKIKESQREKVKKLFKSTIKHFKDKKTPVKDNQDSQQGTNESSHKPSFKVTEEELANLNRPPPYQEIGTVHEKLPDYKIEDDVLPTYVDL